MNDLPIRFITKDQVEEIRYAYQTYAARAMMLRDAFTNIGFTIEDVSDGWLLTKRFSGCSTKDNTTGKCVVIIRAVKSDTVFNNSVYMTVSQLTGKDLEDVIEVASFRLISPKDYYNTEMYGEI